MYIYINLYILTYIYLTHYKTLINKKIPILRASYLCKNSDSSLSDKNFLEKKEKNYFFPAALVYTFMHLLHVLNPVALAELVDKKR